ncbi:hypothetical protein [Kytococcus sedentarius]|uniref:hypothetical protein n=1 Tax=Kytococcus sedentarius TaxID=1276 RepID=UPI0035BC0ECC
MNDRGDAVKLVLIGLVFTAVGVLLTVVGDPVVGVMGICFGLMAVITGIALRLGTDSTAGRWLLITGSLLFAAAGAVMVATHFMEGAPMGWRQPAALPVGLLTVGFFGIGGLLLLWRELRRR